MVYEIIINELLPIFSPVQGTWQYYGVQVIAYTLTVLLVALFLAVPLYLFFTIFNLFSKEDKSDGGGRGYRYKKRK